MDTVSGKEQSGARTGGHVALYGGVKSHFSDFSDCDCVMKSGRETAGRSFFISIFNHIC